jgi:hypothetical protein
MLTSALGMILVLLAFNSNPLFAATLIPVKCTDDLGDNPLQTAIDNAPAGATLEITGTCVGQFIITDKSLILQGKGVAPTLFGARSGTVLTVLNPKQSRTVPPMAVVLKSLTITGGDTELCGGGIHNGDEPRCQSLDFGATRRFVPGGVITLSNVTVTGNRAEMGAGVYNSYGTLTLSNSKVVGNIGRGPLKVLGAGIANLGSATLINTIVAGNNADLSNGAAGGGGIWNTGSLSLTNSIVAGNTSGDGGGIDSAGGSVILTNSVVTGNRDSSSGEGIWIEGGTLKLKGSTVTGNTLGPYR